MNKNDISWWAGYLSAIQDVMVEADKIDDEPILEVIHDLTKRAVVDISKEGKHDRG